MEEGQTLEYGNSISGGLEGYMKKALPLWQRILAVAGGLMMIDPNIITNLVGIAIIGFICFEQYVFKRQMQ